MTTKSFAPSAAFARYAHLDNRKYAEQYQDSIDHNEAFWRDRAACVDWSKPFTEVRDVNFDPDDFRIRWFADGELNVSANCLDRHLKKCPHKPAIIWEGDHPADHRILSFAELHAEVQRMAASLLSLGVKKGDRVLIYMPMIAEAAFATAPTTSATTTATSSTRCQIGRRISTGCGTMITGGDGAITGAQETLRDRITDAQARQAALEVRLTDIEKRLLRTYTQLDSNLSAMTASSQYLTNFLNTSA